MTLSLFLQIYTLVHKVGILPLTLSNSHIGQTLIASNITFQSCKVRYSFCMVIQ